MRFQPNLHPPTPSLQLNRLPSLAQQLIIQGLNEFEPLYTGSLRLCSRRWKHACDAELSEVSIGLDQLGDALPFMRTLGDLQGVVITGSPLKTTTLPKGALSTLTAELRMLAIASGKVIEYGSHPKTTLQDVSGLLFQFGQSLQEVHLHNCIVSGSGDDSLHGPGFFSRFRTCHTFTSLAYLPRQPSPT